MSTQITAPSWDLTLLYSSINDPQIEKDLGKSQELIKIFIDNYKDKIVSLTPEQLEKCFTAIELIWDLLYKPSFYFELSYSAGGSEIDKIGVIKQQIEEKTTKLLNQLTFFEVELSFRNDLFDIAKTPELKIYQNFLEQTANSAKYLKSTEVEQILALKNLSGFNAWAKLYTDLKAKISEKANFEGEEKTYSSADLSNLLYSSDRNIRKNAFELQIKALEKNNEFVSEALNNIALDKKIDDEIRGYTHPHSKSLVSNQWSEETLQALLTAINNSLPVFHEYYETKRQILGLETLESYDLFGQINLSNYEPEYSYEETKEIILEALYSFDPVFGDNAKYFFDNDLIDAQKRERKYPGAFQNSISATYPPYILTNYNGKISDILTLAHELGHGVHTLLTHANQNFINSQYTISMAEIASLCSETLVFESLIKKIEDPKVKLELLCSKIEDEGANIFMAGFARYNFEKRVHEKYRSSGSLSTSQIGEIELEEGYKKLYGKALTPTKGSELKWQLVAHYTYDFYNYAYASGLLTSLAIYKKIQDDPSSKEKYFDILKAGGSKNPRKLLLSMDMDIETVDFWQNALELFSNKVNYVKQLYAEIK
jgi:oligoendopeptidase F